MKTRSQKLISLVLVLMMLVTMIPTGLIVANAAVSEELSTGLADYENTTEFVINNVEDWEAVATSGMDFADKTVKLGADIDANNAALTTLAATFAGTFDGQGYTIKNATVTTTGDAALIATTLTGTVKNLKTKDVTITGEGKVGMIAASATDAVITSVTLEGSVTTTAAASYAGGVVGYVAVNTTNDGFTNIYTNLAVTCAATTNIGGFAGWIEIAAGQQAIISDVYVGGSINNQNTSENAGTGFVGRIKGASSDMTTVASITDIVVDVDMSKCCGNTLTIAGIHNGNLVTQNLYSTTKSNGGTWSGSTQRWSFMSHNTTSYVDGVYNPWAAGDPAGDASVTIVTKTIASRLVVKDAKGFVTSVITPEEIVWSAFEQEILNNYDTASEFVVMTLADWNSAASIDKDFAGKTLKLGANIDANGAEMIPFGTFAGTFDGQNYTIKNATFTATGDAALIATTLTGTVKNINLENCSVTGTAKVGMIAASATNATITNVNATGKVTNTTNAGYTGGIVGYITVATGGSFSNIWSEIVVKAEKVTDGGWLGGFCGQVNITGTADWTMTNCYVGGAIDNGKQSSTNATGLWGKTNGTQSQDIALLTNVIVDMDMSLAYGNSLSIGYHANGNIVTSGLYSSNNVNNGTYSTTTIRWSFLTQNGASLIDGKTNPWAAGDPAGDASVTVVGKFTAYKMPQKSASTGFITGITNPGDLVFTGFDAAINNYDSTSEFVIDSVDDWKLIAKFITGDFKNKTVKLGADIDFGGETAPVLFTAASFYGTLDGQGYTVKNAVVTAAGNVGLFAAKMGGGKITNVTLDNITVNGNGYVGLVIGNSSVYADLEISKINATNITLNNAGTATGGIIGLMKNTGFAAVFTQIDISGKINQTTTAGNVGGVFGEANFSSADAGTTNFSKIKVAMDIVVANGSQVGGFGGYHLSKTNAYIVVSDVYVGGSINDNATNSNTTAAFIGRMAGTIDTTIAQATNIVLNVDMSKAGGNSTVLGTVENGNFVYSNVYSVNKSNTGVHSMQTQRWTGMSYNGNSFFNGVANPWANADPIQNSLIYVDAKGAPMMIKKGADGFVDGVYTTAAVAYQSSAVSDNKYAVRFIAFDFIGDAENVSMNVIARVSDGTGKSFTADCEMFDALTSYTAMGISESRSASAWGAQKIAGLTIFNIPTGNAIDFEVTVTYTTDAGTFSNTMYLSFNASGACTTPAAN